MEFDNYSSHILVFKKILETYDINNVLEFGMGTYSTKYFADNCENVVSVEQEDRKWFDKINSEIKNPSLHTMFEIDPKFDKEEVKFDLVFSDGAAATRYLVGNLAMERDVPVVVLHDSEQVWYYKWYKLNIGSSYSRFDFRSTEKGQKVTTVLVNSKADIVDKWVVDEHDRIIQAFSSPSQPIIQIVYPGDTEAANDKRIKLRDRKI